MIRRLALLVAALAALGVVGAPGAGAEELQLQNPGVLCVAFGIDGFCVRNPVDLLP